MAIGAIIDQQLLSASIDRHIELVLCRVDAGADHAMFAHLPRPFLVMRTLGSFNHPGPSEEPIAILLRTQPKGSGGQRSDDRRSGLGGRLGRTIPSGTSAA